MDVSVLYCNVFGMMWVEPSKVRMSKAYKGLEMILLPARPLILPSVKYVPLKWTQNLPSLKR